MPTTEQILSALSRVEDPEIHRPITELGMVDGVAVEDGTVRVGIKLTVPGCPLKDRIQQDIAAALRDLDGVERVEVTFGSMTPEEREQLSANLRAARGAPAQVDIPFSRPDSPTRVVAIASGKGGVGKSSVTVNLAVALARRGLEVGVLDADIWGYSIPRMMGVEGPPRVFDGMDEQGRPVKRVLPHDAHGCKVISIGFFTQPDRTILWRGPMLHRALQQFLTDVYWGDLDVLLCDLPPGTGDVTISLAQMLPNADMVVVTTPQLAAQRVALRAGRATEQTGMTVAGVIENMAGFTCPSCGQTHELFGTGGGQALAEELGTELLGRIPLDPRLVAASDSGVPLVVSHPDSPAAVAFDTIAERLAARARSKVGRALPLSFSS